MRVGNFTRMTRFRRQLVFSPAKNRSLSRCCRTAPRRRIKVNRGIRDRALTRDWFDARSASLSEQLSETIAAVRLLVPRRKTLSGQRSAAIAAREAFPVPRLVLVRHTAASDYLCQANGY